MNIHSSQKQPNPSARPGNVRSKANSREVVSASYKCFGFKNSGLMIEFRLLIGIGRSGEMIGRICLDMVS